jgi:hypothetical protein
MAIPEKTPRWKTIRGKMSLVSACSGMQSDNRNGRNNANFIVDHHPPGSRVPAANASLTARPSRTPQLSLPGCDERGRPGLSILIAILDVSRNAEH